LLIVETSGLADFETARAFYDRCGFTQEARIQNFFAAGDDKIAYTKPLSRESTAG
jgi:ribosomal protein S18 acetylase RimI-like enzyme